MSEERTCPPTVTVPRSSRVTRSSNAGRPATWVERRMPARNILPESAFERGPYAGPAMAWRRRVLRETISVLESAEARDRYLLARVSESEAKRHRSSSLGGASRATRAMRFRVEREPMRGLQSFAALTVALVGCETRPPAVEAPRTINCDPLPVEDTPCSHGVCVIPEEPDSYLQCTGGRWVRVTEQSTLE